MTPPLFSADPRPTGEQKPLIAASETIGVSDHTKSVLRGNSAAHDAGTVSANIELASSSLDGPATDRFLHIEQDEATCGGRQSSRPPTFRASSQASAEGHNDTAALGRARKEPVM
jgi:hypothetical protein